MKEHTVTYLYSSVGPRTLQPSFPSISSTGLESISPCWLLGWALVLPVSGELEDHILLADNNLCHYFIYPTLLGISSIAVVSTAQLWKYYIGMKFNLYQYLLSTSRSFQPQHHFNLKNRPAEPTFQSQNFHPIHAPGAWDWKSVFFWLPPPSWSWESADVLSRTKGDVCRAAA